MDCKNSALCLFDTPGVLTDTQKSDYVDYYPVNTLSSESPIEFVIPGSSENYIDLGNTKLYVKFKIVHEDGTAIDQTKDFVGLNNLGIATLFADASLTVSDTQVEGGGSDYPYLAYLRTVMQFSTAAQNSSMIPFGWSKDQAGKFDDKTNTGFVKRQTLVGNSRTVELLGPLYFDFFNQDRHLINSTGMKVKLTPHKPEFFLNAYPGTPTKFKIVFDRVILYVNRLTMNPSVINGHAVGLRTQNARYFINHTKIVNYTIPKGQLNHTKEHLFTDLTPKMLMIVLLDNDAYNGNYGKNPFNFKSYNLNKFALLRDGKAVTGQAFEPDFTNAQYLRSYASTMEAFNYWNTDDTNGLTPYEWANGFTIYAFDLTPDKDVASGCRHAFVSGNLRLDLSFDKALPDTINVLVYAVTDSQVEVTQTRDVITHYSR